METKYRVVTVKKIPVLFTTGHGEIFIREMRRYIDIDIPCIVLDCSNLQKLDKPTVYFLLCFLEEVMKHNGDVKLAALSANASNGSDISGINRLFDIYETTDEAVMGFHQFHKSTFLGEPAPSISCIETNTTS